MQTNTLTPELLYKMDAYWRAANYLSVGQIDLYDNPLLKRPLTLADVKHMLLGHWGTTPGQNFIYVHLNRIIKKYDLDMIYVCGPGHGGPVVVCNTYLEGTYSEIYPNISQDEAGLQKLFLQFSFPGGIPSHASPECPGSIHEGDELGYSSVIRSGRCSTIPISSSRASSATARRCCRFCISTATRSPTRPSSPASSTRNWNSCSAATGGHRTSSRVTSPC